MSDQTPNLDLLLRQQQRRILDEMGEFRDQLTVLTAICIRVEGAVSALAVEVRAMHSRHDRLLKRVERLENAVYDSP